MKQMLACLVISFSLFSGFVAAESAPQEYSEREYERAERELFDALKLPWYHLEVVIFERLPVMAFTRAEQLVVKEARTQPYGSQRLLPNDRRGNELVEVTRQDWLSNSIHCFGFSLEPNLLERNQIKSNRIESNQGGLVSDSELDPTSTESNRVDNSEVGRFRSRLAAFEQSLVAKSLIPSTKLSLETSVKLLNRRRHLRPLIHTGWLQAVTSRATSSPIELRFSEANLPPKLIGHIGLTRGRYLHLAADIWYSTPGLGWQPLPVLSSNRVPAPATRVDPNAPKYMRLNESRRMKSHELHYLDHPKMGVLAKVEPVQIPADLVLEFLKLEKPNLYSN